MDITDLEYFKIIAESGSLTKAAQQLHITQPAMSAMLKKLEEELGVELFDRSPNRIHLNKAGRGRPRPCEYHPAERGAAESRRAQRPPGRPRPSPSLSAIQGVRWFSAPRFSVAPPGGPSERRPIRGRGRGRTPPSERVYDSDGHPRRSIQDPRIQSLPFLPDQVYLSVPEDSNLAGPGQHFHPGDPSAGADCIPRSEGTF